MTDTEDDAEFASHFLDSMLEVEMTEEDKELDVSKNYDPLETLPPIPTFDLQSETFSYKDAYKNSIPQPVFATVPLSTSSSSNVPLVLKPSSMLIYSGEVPPFKSAPVFASFKKATTKSNAKNTANNVNASTNVNNTSIVERTSIHDKFVQEVFRPEFVKNVFIKADPPWDISLVSEEEMNYYRTCFKDVTKVQNCKLHCTICDKHLGCAITAEKKINIHTMLKVLTCKPCFEFYGDGNFPCDKGDNCEIYCRWCGQGGALVCCSFCPRVFCKKCVKRNYGIIFLRAIEKASDWACFCCAQKPLWPHRAICRALLEFIARKKTDPKAPLRDTTSCCKAAGLIRKKLRATLEKNKISVPQSQFKMNPVTKNLDSKHKPFSPLKTRNEKLLLKPVVQLKASDRVKISVNSRQNSKSRGVSNIFSPKSIVAGNSIIRGIATTAPAKLFSSFPSPQLIQSPVIHGETLITPPSRFLVQSKSPSNPSPGFNSSYVRVSLTHQAPNVDLNKIPTVKIPHEVQGLVLRLILPDNKMQYVRLTSDGTSCKASKDFPMPPLKEKGASFVEANLAEAFKISKMMYEKLVKIREKVNSRTKFTEESVFNSSIKKLHLAYEDAIDLLKKLDKTLIENHQKWKNETKNFVDVIDISDDETSSLAKKNKPNRYFSLREKCRKPNDDSDIEILDDVLVNGKSVTNGNYKEKYRLRSLSDQERIHVNDNGGVKKRKKGRTRRTCKKLKTAKLQNGNPSGPVEDSLGSGSVEKVAAPARKKVNVERPCDTKKTNQERETAEDRPDGKTRLVNEKFEADQVNHKGMEEAPAKSESTEEHNLETCEVCVEKEVGCTAPKNS